MIPGLGSSPGEGIGYPLQYSWTSLVAQTVKSLPTMWETWVRSLGWEDPLEKGMGTHSSILAWKIPWSNFHFPSVLTWVTYSSLRCLEPPGHTWFVITDFRGVASIMHSAP